jgi:uncharacterized SAM-binding protein YcdF (DUF218 family)
MLFLLKKLVGPLLFPQSLCLELMVLGVLLLWFGARKNLGKILTSTAAAGFLVLNYPILWAGVASAVENTYPPLNLERTDLANVRWVVVLGGGGRSGDGLPATAEVSQTTLMRLVEGHRVRKTLPHTKLLLSGGSVFSSDSDAILMRAAVEILGVRPEDVVLDDQSRDTEEQSLAISRIVKNDRFILVTSALHMPRAMVLFLRLGVTPIPAPTDFQTRRSESSVFGPADLQPNSSGPAQADSLARECLGILWSKLRGRA